MNSQLILDPTGTYLRPCFTSSTKSQDDFERHPSLNLSYKILDPTGQY